MSQIYPLTSAQNDTTTDYQNAVCNSQELKSNRFKLKLSKMSSGIKTGRTKLDGETHKNTIQSKKRLNIAKI